MFRVVQVKTSPCAWPGPPTSWHLCCAGLLRWLHLLLSRHTCMASSVRLIFAGNHGILLDSTHLHAALVHRELATALQRQQELHPPVPSPLRVTLPPGRSVALDFAGGAVGRVDGGRRWEGLLVGGSWAPGVCCWVTRPTVCMGLVCSVQSWWGWWGRRSGLLGGQGRAGGVSERGGTSGTKHGCKVTSLSAIGFPGMLQQVSVPSWLSQAVENCTFAHLHICVSTMPVTVCGVACYLSAHTDPAVFVVLNERSSQFVQWEVGPCRRLPPCMLHTGHTSYTPAVPCPQRECAAQHESRGPRSCQETLAHAKCLHLGAVGCPFPCTGARGR